MRLEYVRQRPGSHHHRQAEAMLTANFLERIAHYFDAAELELAAVRQRTAEPGVSHLHDFYDANQLMLDAMEKTFPELPEDDWYDGSDVFVGSLMDKAWSNVAKTLESIYA